MATDITPRVIAAEKRWILDKYKQDASNGSGIGLLVDVFLAYNSEGNMVRVAHSVEELNRYLLDFFGSKRIYVVNVKSDPPKTEATLYKITKGRLEEIR